MLWQRKKQREAVLPGARAETAVVAEEVCLCLLEAL